MMKEFYNALFHEVKDNNVWGYSEDLSYNQTSTAASGYENYSNLKNLMMH